MEYKVDEEFSLLERDTGRVLLSTPRSVATHYFTFESDYFLQVGHPDGRWEGVGCERPVFLRMA